MAERTPRGGSGWPTAEDPATGGRPLQGPVAAEKEQAPLVRHAVTLPGEAPDRPDAWVLATACGVDGFAPTGHSARHAQGAVGVLGPGGPAVRVHRGRRGDSPASGAGGGRHR